MRVALGFLVAPLSSAFFGALFVGVNSHDFESAVLSFFLLLLAGYGTALVFGRVFFLLLRRLTWLTPQSLAVSGALSGLLFSLLISALYPGRQGWFHAFLNFASIGAPLGAAGGVVFWWVSIRKGRGTSPRQT